jgi:protein O-mannosyl-transferase
LRATVFFRLGKSSGRKRTRVVSAAQEPPAREPAHPALVVSSIITALVAIVFIIYAQVRTHGFINFDDPEYVSANPYVLGGLTWAGVRWAFTHIHAAYWIPLTWISHMIDVQLFGKDAGAHLLVSVALHAANSALVFLFLRKATDSLLRSAAVAALFAVHPMHVESVAWISERKDTLSTLFFLLCLLSYSHYVLRRSRAGYAASVASLAVGMLAKPMLVSTPVVLLLLDYWPFRRTDLRKAILEKIPFALCIVPSAVATLIAQREAMPQLSTVPPLIRVANAAISYVRYVAKTLWPAGLSVIYPFPTRIAPSTAIACAILLVAATTAVIIFRRSSPWLFTGWCWFVVTLIPVIGIVQVGVQSMADRFTYIPHIGLFIAIVWSCAELAPRLGISRALPAAAAIAIAVLAFAAHAQVAYWSGNLPLFEHALAVTSPQNKMAHFNLAAGYMERGDYAAAQREYELAGNLQSASAGRYSALTRLGSDEFKRGAFADAQGHLAEAVRMRPEDYEGRMNYGTLLTRLNRDEEAAEQFSYAAKLRPQSVEPLVYAALIAAKARRFDAAALDIQRAIAVDHDGSNRVLIGAIRIPPRPAAIDEYLAFLRRQSGGH